MGIQVHRETDERACGATTIVVGQDNVYANNLLVSVDGDPNTDGAGELHASAHEVYINNIRVVRIDDSASADDFCPGGNHCDPYAAAASDDVYAGEPTEQYLVPPSDPDPVIGVYRGPTIGGTATPGGGGMGLRGDDGGGVFANSGSDPTAVDNIPPITSGDCARADIGALSAKHESKGNTDAIGNDPGGGYSYGTYQIATKTGTFANYMKFVGVRYPDIAAKLNAAGGNSAATSGSEEFKSTWRGMKNDPGFKQSQHDFIKLTHFDPQLAKVKKATGFDLCDGTHGPGLQDAIWSTAVHHGKDTGVIEKALANAGPGASDAAIINAIYDERSKVDEYFTKQPQRIKDSIAARFVQERKAALAMNGVSK